MEKEYIEDLVKWFDLVKRDFPWRKDRTAYHVLVSEIMLQQTKAVTVLPYFASWLKKFPDFLSLSNASEEEVIKAWEGLGYYSRARNLRNIAIKVVEEFEGTFPSAKEDILSFMGIGPYTAAAISHFAFNKRVLGADGNISKVIARFYGYSERIDKRAGIIPLLDKFLPKTVCKNSFEALIELGATVCSKKPMCGLCPLQGACTSYREELTDVIPVLKKREKTIPLSRLVFIVEQDESILIKKEEKNLMKGLYEFPYSDFSVEKDIHAHLKKWEDEFSTKLKIEDQLKEVKHTFTKYKASLTPLLCSAVTKMDTPNGYLFVKREELNNYPFSSGHRKILSNLAKKSKLCSFAI